MRKKDDEVGNKTAYINKGNGKRIKQESLTWHTFTLKTKVSRHFLTAGTWLVRDKSLVT